MEIRRTADEIIEARHEEAGSRELEGHRPIAKKLTVRAPVDASESCEVDPAPVLPVAEDRQLRHSERKQLQEIGEEVEVIRVVDGIAGEDDDVGAKLRHRVRNALFMARDRSQVEIGELGDPDSRRSRTSDAVARDGDAPRLDPHAIERRPGERGTRSGGEPAAARHHGRAVPRDVDVNRGAGPRLRWRLARLARRTLENLR